MSKVKSFYCFIITIMPLSLGIKTLNLFTVMFFQDSKIFNRIFSILPPSRQSKVSVKKKKMGGSMIRIKNSKLF